MDLSYSSEHQSFQEEVRGFLESHAKQAAEAGGLRTEKGLAWQQTLIEHGYTARTIPKEYGGFGAEPDILKARIIAEEFATAGVSPGLGGQGISMLVPTLLEVGTEEQKQAFIKPTLHGEMLWCQGYSEPGAGSDLASLTTSAVLEADVLATLRWYPLVTFVQLLFDLPMADRITRGNAHSYAARSYIDAWIEVTDPDDWDTSEEQRLKQHFDGR